MSDAGKVIETRTDRIWLRNDGIVQLDAFPNAELKIADAVAAVAAFGKVAGDIKRPLLVNMGQIKSMDREAREYFSGKEAAEFTTSAALITHSPIARVIGNFMMGLNKTLYPTRLFTSEVDALKWLKGFVK